MVQKALVFFRPNGKKIKTRRARNQKLFITLREELTFYLCPSPMTTEINLREPLKQYFGFECFKDNQEAIIRSLLSGHDVFVLMPTGGGKSLCYQLPALLMEGVAIVVSPLIALMKNQVDAIRQVCDDNRVAHFINSSLPKATIEAVKSDILNGHTKLLYVAPEQLTKEDNINFLKSVKISFYAIDEAHCISEWGHDFRPEYRKIRPLIDKISPAPVIALTATATVKVRNDIKKSLGMTDAVEFKSSFNRPNLYYEVRPKTEKVDYDVIRFIKNRPGVSGIIYCLSRKRVEELTRILLANNIKASAYHAGLDAQVRSDTQDAFLKENIDVIVATIAFGMGIDKPDVRFVIHYDIPKSLEGYYQETGRAGRAGGEGLCVAFYSHKDLQKLEKFMESKPVSEQDIGRQLLKETAAYAESAVCRRKLLLHYFGEQYEPDNCDNCDNCKNPKKQVEGKDHLCKVIETVLETKENFRDDYIKDVMMGNATDEVVAHHHDDLECFGIAEDMEDDRVLNAVIKQGLIANYLRKDVDNYGVIKVTPAGKKFLKKPESFPVVEDNDFDDEAIAGAALQQSGAVAALDPQLYRLLKDLRKSMAKELGIPPYVIFQDTSLEAMASTYPQTIEELQNIPGVGSGKAKRYGSQFCDLIRRHCEDNDIERPEDFRFRTVPKKSQLKVDIIRAIDRKIPLDELAKSKGLDFSELLDHVDAIVYSGTKINIDYFLNDVMDEDSIADIFDYFRESDTDSLDEAYDELGDDYTEDEIRLVRIKFLSEMAN